MRQGCKNPTISNPHWENADGQTIAKALVGDEVYICADVQDIGDGATATIKIVEKDADGIDDDVTALTVTVNGGKIECKWKVVYTEDEDDINSEQEKAEKGYTLPEYVFTVECGGANCAGAESEESGQLDVYAKFIRKLTLGGIPLSNRPCKIILADGTEKTVTTNSGGYIIIDEVPIGDIYIL